jgi:hypothetical protein
VIFQATYGYGAIFGWPAFSIISRLSEEEYLTNPGVTLGGGDQFDAMQAGARPGKTNVIAETAVAAGDLRALSVAQRDRGGAYGPSYPEPAPHLGRDRVRGSSPPGSCRPIRLLGRPIATPTWGSVRWRRWTLPAAPPTSRS